MATRKSGDRRHFIIVGVLVAIGTVLVYLLLDGVLPLAIQASEEASIIDGVINAHLWLIAFLFSLVVVFMLYALVVFRRREGDDEDGEHFEGNFALEIAWTAGPLIFVAIFTWIGIVSYGQITQEEPDEIVYQVEAFQWAFRFGYENGTTADELVLPVNQPVRMEMTSEDVIHGFWVNEFRVKQDIVPGTITEIGFTPILEGEYQLRCTKLCGLSHWSMLRPVRVVSEEEYSAWLDEQYALQFGEDESLVQVDAQE